MSLLGLCVLGKEPKYYQGSTAISHRVPSPVKGTPEQEGKGDSLTPFSPLASCCVSLRIA